MQLNKISLGFLTALTATTAATNAFATAATTLVYAENVGGNGVYDDTNTATSISQGAAYNGTSSSATYVAQSSDTNNAAANGHSVVGQYNEVLSTIGSSSVYGNQNTVNGEDANAFGDGNIANGTKAQTYGDTNYVNGASSIGYGVNNTVGGFTSSTANPITGAANVSTSAVANNATAIGSNNNVTTNNATAVGYNNTVSGVGAIVLGSSSQVTANAAIAIGEQATSTGTSAIALGYQSNSSAQDTTAIGAHSTASANYGTAVGRYANASLAESVAIGSGSVTDATATVENTATVSGITYSGFAGQASRDGLVVSVGNAANGEYRQIKNVAAGNISSTSTDAINGSQLYMVASGLTDYIQSAYTVTSSDSSIVVTSTTDSEGHKTYDVSVSPSPTTKKVVAGKNMNVIDSGNTITVATIENPEFTSVTVVGNDGNNVVVDGNGISAGNKRVTNVADGVADTDAVNIRQLNNAVEGVRANVHHVDRKLRAGIAQAGAMANIPQVTKNGGSGLGVAGAHYRGESSLALGYSRLSDNGKHIIKASVSGDSRGYGMVGAGYMYQW